MCWQYRRLVKMVSLRCFSLLAMVFTIAHSKESKKIMCLTDGFMDKEFKLKALTPGCDFITTERFVLDAHSMRFIDISKTLVQLENDERREAKMKSRKKQFEYNSESNLGGVLAHIHLLDIGKFFNKDIMNRDHITQMLKEFMANPYKGVLITAGPDVSVSVIRTITEELKEFKKTYPTRRFLIFLSLRNYSDWTEMSDFDTVISYYLLPSVLSLDQDTLPFDITGKTKLKVTDLKPWRKGDFPMEKALGQLSLNYYEVVTVGKNKYVMQVNGQKHLLGLVEKKSIKWTCYNTNRQLIGFNIKNGRPVIADTYSSVSHWCDKYDKNNISGVVYKWKGEKSGLSELKQPGLLTYLQHTFEEKSVAEILDKERTLLGTFNNLNGDSIMIPRCEESASTKDYIKNVLMDTSGVKTK